MICVNKLTVQISDQSSLDTLLPKQMRYPAEPMAAFLPSDL